MDATITIRLAETNPKMLEHLAQLIVRELQLQQKTGEAFNWTSSQIEVIPALAVNSLSLNLEGNRTVRVRDTGPLTPGSFLRPWNFTGGGR